MLITDLLIGFCFGFMSIIQGLKGDWGFSVLNGLVSLTYFTWGVYFDYRKKEKLI